MFYLYVFPYSGLPLLSSNNIQGLYNQTSTLENPQNIAQNRLPLLNQPQNEIPHQAQKAATEKGAVIKIEASEQSQEINIDPKPSIRQQLPFNDKHNIIPNNINHILAFVQRKSKSQNIIQKIIEKERTPSDPYTTKGFYSYQTNVKSSLSVHVNTKALQVMANHVDYHSPIFSIDEQLFYNKVCRIAIRYYLRERAGLVTLKSQRLKNTNKKDHLKVQRYLLCVMESIKNQGSTQYIKEW